MKAAVAVTGGTGFIGREVIRRLLENGWLVRALTRRCDPGLEQMGVTTISGALEDEASLARLVEGATAVVHCAGAVTAPNAATFHLVNAVGAACVMAAAATSTPSRFLLLSSLAAREPALSAYASSKRLGEDQVRRAAGERIELCILRPPAVYGPGDRATLPVFRQLRRGVLLVPAVAEARFSLIYVEDLADLVIRLLQQSDWCGRVAGARRRSGRRLSVAGSGRDCQPPPGPPCAYRCAAPHDPLADRGGRPGGGCDARSLAPYLLG